VANNPKASITARKNMWSGTSVNSLLGASATINFYSGTVPTYADSALSGNTLLASLAMSATPFGAPSGSAAGDNAVITANAITAATATATGTATFYRVMDSAGTPAPHFQGTVGTSGSDINLGSVAIQSGAQVSLTSYTQTLPA
jgi:hypothetical protein